MQFVGLSVACFYTLYFIFYAICKGKMFLHNLLQVCWKVIFFIKNETKEAGSSYKAQSLPSQTYSWDTCSIHEAPGQPWCLLYVFFPMITYIYTAFILQVLHLHEALGTGSPGTKSSTGKMRWNLKNKTVGRDVQKSLRPTAWQLQG